MKSKLILSVLLSFCLGVFTFGQCVFTVDGVVQSVLCNGEATGSIDLTVTGPPNEYTYSWSSGDTIEDPIALIAGQYIVNVTDSSGCMLADTFNVSEPTNPLTNTTSTLQDQLTAGGTEGSVTLQALGGTTPYTYLWDANAGNQTTQTATGLSPGVYCVVVTDANNCSTQSCAVVNAYTCTNSPQITFNTSNPSCNGISNAWIVTSVSSGTPPYTYSWTGLGVNPTAQNQTGLAAGTYDLTVTDAAGCQTIEYITISEPDLLVVGLTKQDASNAGDCQDGEATLFPSGGTPPYSVLWSNGDTTLSVNNLGACSPANGGALHDYLVSDANGCNVANSVVMDCIAYCDHVNSIDSVYHVSCPSGGDGYVALSFSSAADPAALFDVEWTLSGQLIHAESNVNVSSVSNLSAGIYIVSSRIVDTTCGYCSTHPVEQSVTVLGPPSSLQLTATTLQNQLSNGGSEGSVTVSATGGTPPYTYQWDANAGNQTTQTATGLLPGTYCVTVTDANSCGGSQVCAVVNAFNCTNPPIATFAELNVSCNGLSDGAITTAVNGGMAPYSFQWTGPGVVPTLQNQSGLAPGTYELKVTDASGCQTIASTSITEPLSLVAGISPTSVGCGGASTGALNLTASGGTTPYTYYWSNGVITEDQNNVPAGVYTVLVTDANACTFNASASVGQPSSSLSVNIYTTSATNASACSNGSATAICSGGTPPYSYIWSSGLGTSNTATNMAAPASYGVTVTDANGCIVTQNVNTNCVSNCDGAISIVNTSHVTCHGGNDGSATASASSISMPGAIFDFVWKQGTTTLLTTNGATSSILTGLEAGLYIVSLGIQGTNCPSVEQTIIISEPSNPISGNVLTTQHQLSSGGNEGAIIGYGAGGIPPYTYQWGANAGNSTTQIVNGLMPGTYCALIGDIDGCMTGPICTIVNPDTCASPPVISFNTTNVTCNGRTDGAIISAVSGGVPPYTYVWSGSGVSPTSQNQSGLGAGTYQLEVTDVNGCQSLAAITLSQPSPLSLSIAVSDVLCVGGSTGALDLTVLGGTPPYSFAWNNGAFTEDQSNLPYGTYSVVVTDAKGCNAVVYAIVDQPSMALAANITKTNATSINGCIDGSATALASGGLAPYTYLWSGGFGTNASAIGLTGSGTYSVIVTDVNGCVLTESVNIDCVDSCDAAISIDSITDAVCNGNAGSATVSASSLSYPSAMFTFVWEQGGNVVATTNSDTSSTLSNVPAGVYVVSASIEGTSCPPVFQTLIIGQTVIQTQCSALPPLQHQMTVGGTEGIISAEASGGTFPYVYDWGPNAGNAVTQTVSGLLPGTYCLSATDANGCTSSTVCTVVNPFFCQNPPIVSLNTSNVSCNGLSDGQIVSTVTSGTFPYTYSWTGTGVSPASPHQSGLAAGTYELTVTDANGCSAIGNTTIIEPVGLSTGIASTASLCTGPVTGSLDLAVAGGTPPYSYTWSQGSTTQDVSSLPLGQYEVTITDADGCTKEDTAIVEGLRDSIYINTASCNPLDTGFIVDTFISQNGCDSLHVVYTSLLASDSVYATASSCNPLDTGLVVNNLSNQNGCDSIHVVYTSLLASDSVYATASSCNPLDTGLVENTFFNQNGCDSIHVVYTSLLASDSVYATASSCNPLDTGLVVNNLSNQNGCDSIHVVYTSLLASDSVYATASSCNPLDTGLVVNNLSNQNGCDSIHVVYTSLLASDSVYATASSCNPLDTGLVENTFFNQNGCDSVHVVYTSLLASDSVYAIDSSCNPIDTGLVINNLFNQNGCDSIYAVYTSLIIVQPLTANNDTIVLFMDTPIGGNFHNNDVLGIANGVMLLNPGNGAITHNPDGTFVYTPNPSYTGVDTASYILCNQCACDTAMIFFDVREAELVWPGDADNDGIANNNDVLVLGQHFGVQDLARPNASIAWQAEQAYGWTQLQANGENMVYADCDGLGQIDTADMYVVDSNYNLIHSKVDQTKAGNLFMNLALSVDTFFVGDTIILQVNLGNIANPGTDVYGIAYTVDFDNSIIRDDYLQVDDSNSWLTSSSARLNFDKMLHGQGQIDLTQTRVDGISQSGMGEIARISVVIEDDLHGKDLLTLESYFNLRNVRVVDENGVEIGVDKNDVVWVATQEDTATGVKVVEDLSLSVHPNPFENLLSIQFEEVDNYTVELYSIDGKRIRQEGFFGINTTLNLGELAEGIYYLHVSNGKKRNMLKVMKY